MNKKRDSQSQNRPWRHHYIPVFYTKRWADKAGQLVVFSNPHKSVIDRRKHPSATGYQDQLYQLRGFPDELAQQVEENFFRPVDNWAHDALCLLETMGPEALKGKVDLRSSWTRFMLSLMLRCPEDVEILRRFWLDEFVATDEAPESFQRVRAEQDETEYEQHLFEGLLKLIDHPEVGSFINQMTWGVADTSSSRFRLLSSDRPIIQTALKTPQGHIGLPIGPSKLFMATSTPDLMRELMRVPTDEVVRAANEQVVKQAKRYVYASDLSQRRFIENNFGRKPKERLIVDILRRTKARHPERVRGAVRMALGQQRP